MLLLATTAIQKVQAVPPKIWMNLGLGILILVAAIILIKKAAEMNKMLMAIIICVVVTIVGFNWIYSRNEPKFLSPIIDRLAPFFPSQTEKAQKAKKQSHLIGP
ncbi:MAG: hypothetical protein WC205_00570 [Opitutaceae bacterium]|jgi:hypothetical protein